MENSLIIVAMVATVLVIAIVTIALLIWAEKSKSFFVKLAILIPFYLMIVLEMVEGIVEFFVDGRTFLGVVASLALVILLVGFIVAIVLDTKILLYRIIKKTMPQTMDKINRFDHFEEADFRKFFLAYSGDVHDIESSVIEKTAKPNFTELQVRVNETDKKRILKYVGLELQKRRQGNESFIIKVYADDDLFLVCGLITKSNIIREISDIPTLYKFMLVDALEMHGSTHQYFICDVKR